MFSPDGQWLITGTPGGYRVWNTETWQPEGFCLGEPAYAWMACRAVAFSRDGKLLVTAGHPGGRDSGHQFQVWDFPSLTVRSNFASFPGKLGSAVFAPDGEHLLTGRDDGVLLVWNVAEGRVVETLNEHTGWITEITYAHDGQTFATASCDRTLVLWDASTRTPLVRLRGHLGEVWSVAISPDGRMLASGSKDGTARLWDATTRHEQRELPKSGLVTGFSSDSRRLVTYGFKDSRVWHPADGTMKTIPLENYTELHGRDWPTCSDVNGIEPLAVYGRSDGVLEFWNLATMSRVTSWQAHEREVATAVFSPDGQFIATSGEKGDVKLWEAETRREVRRFEAWRGKLMCLTFSPDGQLLAGSEEKEQEDSRVGIWDVNTGGLLRELPIDGRRVPSVAFSPDGKLLATADVWNNTTQLWDIPSGKLRATLRGHIQAVFSVAFSPDGKTLATGADDRKVKLWNIATQQEVATLKLPGACRSVKFSPDGRTLAVGYIVEPETYIRLWEVPSFEEIDAAEARLRAESNNKRPR